MAESASRNWRATLLSDLDASIQKFHSLAGSKFDGELVARELNRWFKLIRDGGADPECLTCHGDPAVCATVPGLRHCEAANRDQSAVSELGRDTARLDWLQKVKNVEFSATNNHAMDISRVAIFTVATQRITAPSVRQAIDDAMDASSNERPEGSR